MAKCNSVLASLSAMALCAFVALGCSEDAPGSSSSSAGGSYGGAAGSPQGDGGSEIGGTGGSSAGGSSSIGGSYGGAAGSPQGGSAGTGGSGGILFGCTPDDLSGCDPLANPDCASLTCNEGECGIEFTPDGIMLLGDKQTAGDCQELVCDGAGGTKSVPANDVKDDGKSCTLDSCANGNPVHDPIPPGLPCAENGGKMCDGAGNCVECVMDLDCASGVCQQGKCVVATCDDLIKNNAETDVDCGGGMCAKCGDGKSCVVANDCQSGYCTNDACVPECTLQDLANCEKPVNPDCATATCADGKCGWVFQPDGTVLPQGKQQPGDCQELVCDGAGGTKSVPANDVKDDGKACTLDDCSNGNPVHDPIPPGLPCAENGGKMCDGAGNCVECNANADCQGGNACQQNKCVVNACPPWQPGPGLTCGAWTTHDDPDLAAINVIEGGQALSKTDVFVFGGTYSTGKIVRYNGVDWIPQNIPSTFGILHDFIAFDPTEAYAVAIGPEWEYDCLVLQLLDKNNWFVLAGTPKFGPTGGCTSMWGKDSSDLFLIAGAAKDPAVYRGPKQGPWAKMTFPKFPLPLNAKRVWGTSTKNVYVVGSLYEQGDPVLAVLLHYDGNLANQWVSVPLPSNLIDLNNIHGANECFVVAGGRAKEGGQDKLAVIYLEGEKIVQLVIHPELFIQGLMVRSENQVFAPGNTAPPFNEGRLGLDTGNHGLIWTSPMAQYGYLRNIAAVPNSNMVYVFAEGNGGSVLSSDCN